MSENWSFQWSGKDKSGAMLNVRADSAKELRDRIGDLFGLGADNNILAGFYAVPPEVRELAMGTQEVAQAFNGTVVEDQWGNGQLAQAPVRPAPANDGATCPTCQVGKLRLRNGKKGRFYGCSNFPNCRHTQDV